MCTSLLIGSCWPRDIIIVTLLGDGCHWQLVGGGQGCYSATPQAQAGPTPENDPAGEAWCGFGVAGVGLTLGRLLPLPRCLLVGGAEDAQLL